MVGRAAPGPVGPIEPGSPTSPGRQDLVIVGGGEHARVVIDAALSRPQEWRVLGFLDPSGCEETQRRYALKRLGDDSQAGLYLESACFILGLGGLQLAPLRDRLAREYDRHGAHWATVVHVAAHVSPAAQLGSGVVVLAGAVANTGAVLEDHCVLNTGAIVEHDARIGCQAQVGPGAVVGGGALVGEAAFLGLGCRIRDHVTIGPSAVVGMGAVVVKDVPDAEVVAGVPARRLSKAGHDA